MVKRWCHSRNYFKITLQIQKVFFEGSVFYYEQIFWQKTLWVVTVGKTQILILWNDGVTGKRAFPNGTGTYKPLSMTLNNKMTLLPSCKQAPPICAPIVRGTTELDGRKLRSICLLHAWGALCNVKLILYVNTAQMQIDFKKSAFECVGRRSNWSRFHEYASWASYFMEMYGNYWRPGRVKKRIRTCEVQKSARIFTSAVVKTDVYTHSTRDSKAQTPIPAYIQCILIHV